MLEEHTMWQCSGAVHMVLLLLLPFKLMHVGNAVVGVPNKAVVGSSILLRHVPIGQPMSQPNKAIHIS